MNWEIFQNGEWLPYVFAFLIGLSMLLYAILDGYDLGVGLLSRGVKPHHRDRMIASIGPFWDANETWLVLGVGLLLVAFPTAHGVVLGNLYLPVALMMIGLIFRGVSFDFRKKVPPEQQGRWNLGFFLGSLVVALSQGYMVGRFVIGFQEGITGHLFACFFGLLVVAGYILMGACWLVLKTEAELQQKAVRWARRAIWIMVLCALLSSLTAPFVNTRIYDRMFAFPEITLLFAMPLLSVILTLMMHFILGILPLERDRLAWMPLAISVSIFVLGFLGLVYSFYPYIIPGHLLIVDAAAAPESLMIMLIGTLVVLPFLVGYTALAYWIFKGKATDLSYD
ncbi:cytochrome d ubiquinol oxidase subunit II [Coraliomargarita akajimensis]|uniref:Cytochrome d ubiquinol oxidase, subunit II n=1 Tax=Coraliomargarita akajimensis (strain DSM 45221 / IAM 15411 / JCM 23193 / KCTC 12865 / 04OKA010-24) TaxID=583355 RepID=D5ELB7_CORAD|nr:cytochrome d ubiquinol oxidase subunit II [Coraliomargarita akajimensis]ADE55053.1 cytochrome d ubiquinol oxidase, subunit II [Coraliomargarita akajimensis DSM 45221]